jgi:hypothetical protein
VTILPKSSTKRKSSSIRSKREAVRVSVRIQKKSLPKKAKSRSAKMKGND